MMGAYYGPATEIASPGRSLVSDEVNFTQTDAWTSDEFDKVNRDYQRERAARRLTRLRLGTGIGFQFRAPSVPTDQLIVEDKGEKSFGALTTTQEKRNSVNVGDIQEQNHSGLLARPVANRIKGSFDVTTTQSLVADQTLRLHFEPTKFNEEWRTPPLWGVADSAPYMHDGRAATLLEAIVLHGGESEKTRDRFLMSSKEDRDALIRFLNTLVAPQGIPQFGL